MGSGSSSSVQMDFETFSALKATYESLPKDTENEVALKVLQETYDTNINFTEKQVSSDIQQVYQENANDEASKMKRNALFLCACGAYNKDTTSATANLSTAKALMNNGVDVNYKDEDGWTALFHAAGEGHLSVVEWLTSEECGAQVDIHDTENCTPLWVAAFNGRRNVVQYLLRIGADERVRAKPAGEPVQTPSLAARRNRHPGIADLIDAETQLRASDENRRKRQIAREMDAAEFKASMREVISETENMEIVI